MGPGPSCPLHAHKNCAIMRFSHTPFSTFGSSAGFPGWTPWARAHHVHCKARPLLAWRYFSTEPQALLEDPATVADDWDAFAFGGHSGYVEVVAADHYVDVDLGDVEAAVARDFCVRETR